MNVQSTPVSGNEEILKNLGPLAALAGAWEGDQGLDTAPSKAGPVETPYRERMTFEPFGPVVNGAQILYALRYRTTAWPLGQKEPFHEELGYWLWEPAEGRVMRWFLVPRGVAVGAGGTAAADARSFTMKAELGSPTFGLLSNPFLDEAFQTVRYELEVEIRADGTFSYAEDTVLKIPGLADLFHHTDRNTLARTGGPGA